MKLLLLGYFSTVGDIEVLEVLKSWLNQRNLDYDIAAYSSKVNDAIEGSKDILNLNATEYTHLVIICGPFWKDFFINNQINLNQFSHCITIGFNLSLIESLDVYNPFDYLIARDYVGFHQPDISFLLDVPKTPVFGVCLAPEQKEYNEKQKHNVANKYIHNLIANNDLSAIKIDTQWPISRNSTWINSPTAFESVCSRVDVMLTTRLHGLVLALKQGVPVIAIDAISGGGKVTSQGNAIGWPFVFSVDELNGELLTTAIQKCLSLEYRNMAKDCANRSKDSLIDTQQDFYKALTDISVNKNKQLLPTKSKFQDNRITSDKWYNKFYHLFVKIANRIKLVL